MRSATHEKLAQLAAYDWFANVLQPLTDSAVIAVGSWQEAIESAGGDVWQSVQTQMRNQLAEEVSRASYSRYLEWDDLVIRLRQSINHLLEAVALPLITRHDLPQSFQHWMRWDLLFICLEVEYSDIRPPKSFLPTLDYWYGQGRYPCGWDGQRLETGWKGELARFKLLVL